MPPKLKLFLDLLDKGSLPASRLRAAAADLRTPMDAEILQHRGRGAGEVIAVVNPEAFKGWIKARYPGAFEDFTADAPRAANLAMNRNTKRGKQGLDYFSVSARVHGVPEWLALDDIAALKCIMEATHRFGGACLFLGVPGMGRTRPDPALPKGLRLMTVEGPTNFDHSVDFADQADAFLMCGTGGRMRDAFIDWLASQEPAEVLHFGDYDPVGLQEFEKLARRIPGKVRFHLAEDLEQQFHRWSNRELLDLDGNRKILASLSRGLHPSADVVLDLVHRYGPLEQEGALLRRVETGHG